MITASSASAGSPSGLQTAWHASSEAPPSNTLSRASSARCGGSSTSHDHSSVARSERWRSGRSRGPQLSSSSRLLEALEQRRERQQPRAVGGQLDRQRQPVQPRADLRDDVVVVGRRPVRPRRGHARREQRRGVGDRQRLHAVGVLGGQPQRRAAGREHGQVRRRGEQLRDLRGVGEEALEAVEHEQRARAAAWRARAARRARPGSSATTPSAAAAAGTSAPASSTSRSTYAGAAGEAPGERPPGLQRQPRLADAAGADQCQQADFGPDEQRADLGQLALAADRRVRRRRQRRGEHVRLVLGVELGIVGEDHRLEPAQLRAGLEPELVDQEPAALAHHLERVRLASGAVERQHQLPAQPLAQRVLGHERAQLADQVDRLAAGELGREPLLDRLQPQLLQARDLALGELVEAMVGQRRAAPQRERDASCAAARVGRRARRQQRLEAAAVDRLALDLQRVARRAPADRQPLAQARPQARDLLLQRLVAAVRRLVAPHRLDQLVDRHRLRRPQRERDEEPPLLGAFELHAAARDRDLQRPQQPDLDSRAHGPLELTLTAWSLT